MFFYVSFLRPPPRASDVSTPISVTPQIANDLRTLYLPEASDLFYSWSPSLHDCATSSIASTARKLTTWRASSMYKGLTIPPPPSKPGQEWRLALKASPKTSFVIDLASNSLGSCPLPVISMPVQLEEAGKKMKSLAKQEQIERLYAIPAGSEKQSTLLSIREQTSFDLDKKIWDSGLGLSSWLTITLLTESAAGLNPLVLALKNLLVTRKSDRGLRILELGAGTGIVSISLSTLLEKLQNAQNTQVFATDLPSAIELIEHNISSNKPAYPTLPLEGSTLDWDEETLPPCAQGPIDLLVMADVTYNTASFPALVRTLGALVNSSKMSAQGRVPAVLLAYKQRDRAERGLWPMLRGIGIHMTLVDSVKGAGEEPIEIWLWDECSRGRTISSVQHP